MSDGLGLTKIKTMQKIIKYYTTNTTQGYVKIILYWTKCKKKLILISKMTSTIPH